ncbi:MAG: hypothetical protein A2150_04665 [Candidatus Muproteobacteria bacterium RBG_16_64_11]|uniref:YaiO beta-barrel domain-containing protein n=1 Tax=Candidatus Muproteobacteria bacterium RBG_16_64_11 TaxID=1817758 RepID=A0A1F6TBG9_9PROT|nr:MAG: hypothetical protein A2150_04665 [Candidatus Muproteobacteria bacterium RBG_16_64_11]
MKIPRDTRSLRLALAMLLSALPVAGRCVELGEIGSANHIEAGVSYSNLTNGYSDWRGTYVRGAWHQNKDLTWDFEANHDQRYDQTGQYYAVGATYLFNEDWFGSLHYGVGSDVVFFPKSRVDAAINYRWLEQRNLITTLGVGHINENDNLHENKYVLLGASYYFTSPFIIEAGLTKYYSSPGDVESDRVFLALTYGQDKVRYITLRHDTGNEAYQLVSEEQTLVDFDSNVTTLIWREWWRKNIGTNLLLEFYENPFYERRGAALGVFVDF